MVCDWSPVPPNEGLRPENAGSLSTAPSWWGWGVGEGEGVGTPLGSGDLRHMGCSKDGCQGDR